MKRAFDLIVASALLVVLSPLLIGLSVAIWRDMGAPVLFRQRRPGHRARPFTMIKFRTMREAHAPDGSPLPDGERITPLGAWLRRTSLDELPELWNVLRGEMSLVGPRPLLMEYLDHYSPEEARRHEVRPGVTGWAQVNGRNAITWPEKFALDVWYVDNHTVWLDLRIIALTVRKVLAREGISAPGDATMPRFEGSPAAETPPRSR